MSLKYKYNPDGTKAYAKKLWKYERVVSIDQLSEGMVLIDQFACKRTILSISKDYIWLSHKYGLKSTSTGREWPIYKFLELKNWIFSK